MQPIIAIPWSHLKYIYGLVALAMIGSLIVWGIASYSWSHPQVPDEYRHLDPAAKALFGTWVGNCRFHNNTVGADIIGEIKFLDNGIARSDVGDQHYRVNPAGNYLWILKSDNRSVAAYKIEVSGDTLTLTNVEVGNLNPIPNERPCTLRRG